MRVVPLFFLFCLIGTPAFAPAQPSPVHQKDAEKRDLFLRAREQMRTVPATPPPTVTPAPKPRPARPVVGGTAPGRPASPPFTLQPEPTPRPAPITPPPTRPPQPSVTPKPETLPPRPGRSGPTPQVTIEKSGVAEERGEQPAPPRGWWPRWKYLTRDVREAIDDAPVKRNRWRYIVVHNSGTRQGNAKAFQYYHLRVRKMPNGLAYHFVIGNGTSSGDGEIEIGGRWRRQVNGGHVHSDYLNNIALGICLVGDYNRESPTKRQLESLEELIRYLRQRVGRIDRKWAIIKAHREINPPRWPTDCPGDRFPYKWMHGRFD